jgi:predicted N-acetyltransferase YhbS
MVQVREANLADIPLLTRLILEAFEEYRGKIDPPSGAHDETEASVRKKLAQGGGLIAEIDGHAGGAVLYYPQESYMYLGRLAVLNRYRHIGVGRLLVQGVEAKAQRAGYNRVQLTVLVALPGNRTFFESLGYTVISLQHHAGWETPTYAVLEKRLLTESVG